MGLNRIWWYRLCNIVDHSLPRLLLCTAVCASFLFIFSLFSSCIYLFLFRGARVDGTCRTWHDWPNVDCLSHQLRAPPPSSCAARHTKSNPSIPMRRNIYTYISQLKKGIAEKAGGVQFFYLFLNDFSRFHFLIRGERKKLAMTFRSENSANFHKVSEWNELFWLGASLPQCPRLIEEERGLQELIYSGASLISSSENNLLRWDKRRPTPIANSDDSSVSSGLHVKHISWLSLSLYVSVCARALACLNHHWNVGGLHACI